MKNTLGDLNNHLFAQLERLNDEELAGDKLFEEIGRAKAVTGIASQIIANGNLVLNSIRTKGDYLQDNKALPEIFPEATTTDAPAGGSGDKKTTKKLPKTVRSEYTHQVG